MISCEDRNGQNHNEINAEATTTKQADNQHSNDGQEEMVGWSCRNHVETNLELNDTVASCNGDRPT